MAVESPFVIRLLLLPLFALPEWRTDGVKPLLPGTHAVVTTTPQIAQLFNGHHITGNSSGPPICHCGERMEEELGTLWRSSTIQRPLTYAMGITSTHFHEFQYIDVPPTHIGTQIYADTNFIHRFNKQQQQQWWHLLRIKILPLKPWLVLWNSELMLRVDGVACKVTQSKARLNVHWRKLFRLTILWRPL